MYKKSPNRYREEEEFYPLQLKYVLNENPTNLEEKEWQDTIVFASSIKYKFSEYFFCQKYILFSCKHEQFLHLTPVS
jgi:hypothetical protein